MRGPIETKFGPQYKAGIQRIRNTIGSLTSYEDYIKTVNSPEFKALLKPEPKYNKEMLRFLGGMALQQGLGSIAEYMQASGNQNTVAAGGAL